MQDTVNKSYASIDSWWKELLADILDRGSDLDSRAGDSKELIGYSARLEDPRVCILHNEHQKFSSTYAAGELLWYLAETCSGDFIKYYAPSYARFLEEDGNANGAYGGRWAESGGLSQLVQLLDENPNTRQAVLSMWGPRDLIHAVLGDKKDIPCTIALMFFVRGGELNCVTTMRSNDAWLGFPNDVFTFCQLQCLLAEYLGLPLGFYQHNVGSMHLYAKDYPSADIAARQFVPAYMAHRFEPPTHTFEHDRDVVLEAEELARKGYPMWEPRCIANRDAVGAETRFAWLLKQAVNRRHMLDDQTAGEQGG